jgi:ABC-type transport system substrate-binding protein
MLVAGITLLVLAGLTARRASARLEARDGGTLNVAITDDVDSLDPTLAFQASSWGIEYATCATLMIYPDTSAPAGSIPVPEAAVGSPTISADGKTYVFVVRPGLRFSDGSPITAANFAAAIKRGLDPAMQSYASFLLSDVAFVSARGRKLRIVLKKPAGDLVEVLALPFFCPVPVNFPVDPAGVDLMVGSGPYYVASRAPGQQIILRRNRFYTGRRPHHPDTIRVNVGTPGDAQLRLAEAGKIDVPMDVWFLALSSAEVARLIRQYGLGRRQLFLKPTDETFYLSLNTQSPLFRDNAPLRRAINFAVDRHEIARQFDLATHRRTDQLLPSVSNGYVNARIYPIAGSDLVRARQLARGHLRNAHVVFYSRPADFWQKITSIVVYNLQQLGLTVEVKSYPSPVMLAKAGTRGEPFDIALNYWAGDTPDPANFVVSLLYGGTIGPSDNLNQSYFDEPAYNRRIRAADALTGAARYRAFGQLEVDIMRNEAPVVPLFNSLARVFVSARVGCFTYNPFMGIDYAALCLS